MGKVIGGDRAAQFFAGWRQRIQEGHSFPLTPAVREAFKAEYKEWYWTNLGILRTDSAASSALANCNPAFAGKKKVGDALTAHFAAAACPL